MSWMFRSDNKSTQQSGGSMASIIINAKIPGMAYVLPAIASHAATLKSIYEQHQNRIYNLAFYLTDSELLAEQVTARVFSDTFAVNSTPSAEVLDRELVNVLRESMPIGQ